MSGISLQHANLRGTLTKNREKIISDLDLFFYLIIFKIQSWSLELTENQLLVR